MVETCDEKRQAGASTLGLFSRQVRKVGGESTPQILVKFVEGKVTMKTCKWENPRPQTSCSFSLLSLTSPDSSALWLSVANLRGEGPSCVVWATAVLCSCSAGYDWLRFISTQKYSTAFLLF